MSSTKETAPSANGAIADGTVTNWEVYVCDGNKSIVPPCNPRVLGASEALLGIEMAPHGEEDSEYEATTDESSASPLVSTVDGAHEITTHSTYASRVIDLIRQGQWKTSVANIRRVYAEAVSARSDPKKAVKALKEALPGVLWSGTFSKRNKEALLAHSGLLCADLDGLTSDRIAELKQALHEDEHISGCFLSPTGTGLKVLVRVPPQLHDAGHKLCYFAVEERFLERYGVQIDQHCKDVSRMCFVSHDPEAWWRPDATELPAAAAAPRPSGDRTAPKPKSIPPGCIVVPSGNVSITESARAILEAIAPARTLFWRGGAIVELVEVGGVAGLEILRPEAFRSRVERYGYVFAWRTGKDGQPVLKPARMSRDDAAAIMASADAREMLPPIASVVRCPVITEGPEPGTVSILGKGYHPEAGGLLIVSNVEPVKMTLEEARETLCWLVEEFDFRSQGDRARALAAFITPALRLGGWLKGNAPIDVAEANESQSGKGYRHQLVAAVYGESTYLLTNRSGGVGSIDESFASAVIKGRPFIALDNLRGRFDSQNLEAFVTCPGLFPARIPHRGEVLIDPKRFILQLTSNGLEATRDLANRASICRIRKRPGFAYRDTLGELLANPGRYIGAVFSLVAEWCAAGKPRTKDCRHDFREWNQTLDWISRELLCAGPLMDGHEAAQERASNPALSWLRVVALALDSEGRLGEALSATELVDLADARGMGIPGAETVDPDRSARTVGSMMRRVFSEGDEVELEGFVVRRTTRWQNRDDATVGGGFEVKTYTFTKP